MQNEIFKKSNLNTHTYTQFRLFKNNKRFTSVYP